MSLPSSVFVPAVHGVCSELCVGESCYMLRFRCFPKRSYLPVRLKAILMSRLECGSFNLIVFQRLIGFHLAASEARFWGAGLFRKIIWRYKLLRNNRDLLGWDKDR